MRAIRTFGAAAVVAAACGVSQGSVVFQCDRDNGFFTPFGPTTPSSWKYGDSGWFGSGSDAGVTLQSITLGLAVFSNTAVPAGTTDLNFTFNDGDPSGLVFGSSTQLYSATITGVSLPALGAGGVDFLSLTIPLPGVTTLGGYNNVGWSIQTSNYAYGGNFGFQCSSTFAQPVGFYTNNASFYNGSSWSLFAFSSDPNRGVANFVAQIEVPAPGTIGLVASFGLLAARRRRP